MKKLILMTMTLLVTLGALAGTGMAESQDLRVTFKHEVASPDGRLHVTVLCDNGRLFYEATLDGQKMLERSALGLKTSIGDLSRDLKWTSQIPVEAISKQYKMRGTKAASGNYQANALTLTYENKDKVEMSIIFQVSNNEIAFRYAIPEQKIGRKEMKRARILSELSSFNFPDGTKTFISPQIGPETGWEQTKPSYEEGYSADGPMTDASQYGHGYIFPALFHLPNGWALVAETGVGSNYCASHLSDYQAGIGYTVAYPDPGENNGFGSDFAAIPLPGETPWRTITLGSSLQNIVETTVAWDVVKPKYKASKNYTYGAGSWSWIIGMDSSCNFDEQKRYIDFSAAMGYRSVLIDAFWDRQIGYERMAELARYGKSKGVGIFLWYNSNGSWNDAPQTPIGKMDRPAVRRQEMKWMHDTGILGIKVDFFGGDKQPMMQLYEDILTDANDFGLQVIFHGCTLPRGWERMYPNYVASEAVLASENLHFGQGACDAEARNACIHPFVRNTVGSMDFGGSTLNKYYNADNAHGTVRRTSDVYAMATAVLFQSSVQHFAMAPNNLTDAPAWAVDFMKDVPTTWDEVHFIDGYPGKYVVLARRSGDTWYVVGINAQDQPLKRNLYLPMFAKNSLLTVYSDNVLLQGSVRQEILPKKQQLTITIPKNGGVVIKN